MLALAKEKDKVKEYYYELCDENYVVSEKCLGEEKEIHKWINEGPFYIVQPKCEYDEDGEKTEPYTFPKRTLRKKMRRVLPKLETSEAFPLS